MSADKPTLNPIEFMKQQAERERQAQVRLINEALPLLMMEFLRQQNNGLGGQNGQLFNPNQVHLNGGNDGGGQIFNPKEGGRPEPPKPHPHPRPSHEPHHPRPPHHK